MQPKKIIFDTDLGGDCDDVVALDLLLSAHKAGECDLIGVSYSYTCRTAPGCIYEILRQHGCENIPIARMDIPADSKPYAGTYATPVVEKFGDENTPTYENVPEAVRFLRTLLACNEHVTLVVTGSMSNLCGLMASRPDDVSPLDGMALMEKSVDEVAVMGCNFWHENAMNPDPGYIAADGTLMPVCEWNIFCDIPAARYAFHNCPVPLVCSPFELGFNMFSGGEMCRYGKGETPDSLSLLVHGAGEHGQHSWDPATALYGIYGARPWFYKTVKGQIVIDEQGVAHFDTLHGGRQCLIECAQPREQIGADIDRLIMRLFEQK